MRVGLIATSRSGSTYIRRFLCNTFGLYDPASWLKKNSFKDITLSSFRENIDLHLNSYSWLARLVAEEMVNKAFSIVEKAASKGVIHKNKAANQKSKILRVQDIEWTDYLITLCGDARDKCPILDINKTHIHWELEDPAKYKGDNKIDFFRRVRNQIKKHINNLRDQIEK